MCPNRSAAKPNVSEPVGNGDKNIRIKEESRTKDSVKSMIPNLHLIPGEVSTNQCVIHDGHSVALNFAYGHQASSLAPTL
jgi:hypothetical protein